MAVHWKTLSTIIVFCLITKVGLLLKSGKGGCQGAEAADDKYCAKLMAKELHATCSERLDDISLKIAKFSIGAISTALAEIINCSTALGTVRNGLEIAKVIPNLKLVKKTLGNYKLISILPYVSKFVGEIIYERMMAYITVNNILYQDPYGFHKGHSTFMAIMDIYKFRKLEIA